MLKKMIINELVVSQNQVFVAIDMGNMVVDVFFKTRTMNSPLEMVKTSIRTSVDTILL